MNFVYAIVTLAIMGCILLPILMAAMAEPPPKYRCKQCDAPLKEWELVRCRKCSARFGV